jgi:hypothetical protein
MDNCKSLLTSLFQREAVPLFGKEGPGEISNNRSSNYETIYKCKGVD